MYREYVIEKGLSQKSGAVQQGGYDLALTFFTQPRYYGWLAKCSLAARSIIVYTL
jgi:hypothetical protein